MDWKLVLRRSWRGLRVIVGVYNAGRLFSGVLDMLDLSDK